MTNVAEQCAPAENPHINFADTAPTILARPVLVVQPHNNTDRIYCFLAEKYKLYSTYLMDKDPIPVDKRFHRAIVDVYKWVSWCLHVWTIVKIICASFFYNRMNSDTTFLIILAVFSGFGIYMHWSDLNLTETLSTCLLAACACDPLFVDYSTTNRALPFYPPPPLIIPISIFWVVQLMGPNFGHRHRENLIATVLTPAMIFYVFFGLVANGYSITYYFWTIVLLSFAVIDLQMKIGHFRAGFVSKCIVYEQFISVFWLICTNYIFMHLFSVSVKSSAKETSD